MTDQKKNYQNVSVTDLENARVKIEGELTKEKLDSAQKKALDKLRANTDIDGFRKGNVPDDVLVSKYGEMGILQDAAEIALSEEYPTLLQDHEVPAIGQPYVSITKLAPGEPLGFSITTARMPEVQLPDYKQVAKETLEKKEHQPTDTDVTDEEFDETVLQVRRNVAQQRQAESGIETMNPDDALPDLTDEFVRSLGEFSNVDDFKKKIKESIKAQKRQQEKEKRRIAVMEELIDRSEITMPDIVIEGELDRMIVQLKENISKAGMRFNDYLKQIGKNEEDLRQEWRPQAEKKAKSQLILNHIAVKEQLSPDQDVVSEHMERIMKEYPNANSEQVKIFVETQLLNEKVLLMLENQASETIKTGKGNGPDSPPETDQTDREMKEGK